MQKYEIIDVIDQGAYGIVWKALNKQTGGLVAIKQFKEGDEDQFSRRTIQREIKMLKMLKSQFVIGIREAFRKKGKIYLIFQYFQCTTVVSRYVFPMQPLLINEIVYKLVRCLRFLHSKNIVHRDIKPQNILLDKDQVHLKLCDFGFARFLPDSHYDLTEYVATRWYRAPQLLVGQPYSKPVDMWAVGCIIGELVDAQPMFPGDDEVDQLHRVRQSQGELTPAQMQFFNANPKFTGVKLPVLNKTQTIEMRYLGKIEKNALSFMKKCLRVNPSERMSVEDAFKHPYLLHFSLIDNEFANDQQNLLNSSRRLVKVDSKNLFSEDTEEKKYTSVNSNTISRESIDPPPKRTSNEIQASNGKLNTIKENGTIFKKKSHTNLIKQQESELVSMPKRKHKNQSLQKLNKLLAEEKDVRVNVDFNIKINFKMGEREELSKRYPNKNSLQQLIPVFNSRLPEITKYAKNYGKNGHKQEISRKNQLIGIIGESKELVKVKN